MTVDPSIQGAPLVPSTSPAQGSDGKALGDVGPWPLAADRAAAHAERVAGDR